MRTTEEKIRQVITDIFLSEGSYEDLESIANGEVPDGEVTKWMPMWGFEYSEIIDMIDTATRQAMDVVKSS